MIYERDYISIDNIVYVEFVEETGGMEVYKVLFNNGKEAEIMVTEEDRDRLFKELQERESMWLQDIASHDTEE